MKFITIFLYAIMICSCSFRAKEDAMQDQAKELLNKDELTPSLTSDSDGDGVKDQEELSLGRNLFLADLPILDVKFLQNFKITGRYEGDESGQFTIDTKVEESDPDFKYREGHIFARHHAYNQAASIGIFSTHNFGKIETHDLSRVRFPDIDPVFFHHESLKNRKYLDEDKYKLTSLTIDLESTIKLKANGLYKSIKNLKLKFYYFDYEKDSYELLQEVLVDRHFNAGVRETFTITLENIPLNLLKDNFFKKGEFIISELSDFEIPELETTYKKLISQVKQKSIPLVFNTPRETSIYYIGANGKGLSFQGLLTAVFDKQFEISNNELIKVGQFSNNLSDYTYLNEIKNLDKKGKWFLLTDQLNQHYLDYKFTPKDHLILSYITGKELASERNETVSSYWENISGGDDEKKYPLGNVTPNSEIDIQIRPERSWGTRKTHYTEVLDQQMGSCGKNCTRFPIYCHWEINNMTDYNDALSFSREFGGSLDQIELLVGNDSFNLTDLVKRKLVNTFWRDESLHLQILDISKIKEIVNYEENQLFLKIKTKDDYDFWGVRLFEAERSGSRGMGGCAYLTPAVAFKYEAKYLSNESIQLGDIQTTYNQVLTDEGRRKLSFKSQDHSYQRISVSVSSTIQNNFN